MVIGGKISHCDGSGIYIENTGIHTRRITIQGHPLIDDCGTGVTLTTQGGGVIVRMFLTAQINFCDVAAAIAVNDPMLDFIGDFANTGGADGSMWFDFQSGRRKLRKSGAWVSL